MKNDAVSQKEWNESNDMREQATVWESSKRWKEENEAKCPKIINALKVRSPGFIHRDEGFRNAPHFEEEKKNKKNTSRVSARQMVPPCGGNKNCTL